MKHLIKSLFVAVLICMATCEAFAYAAKIDGIYYNFSGDKVSVTYRDSKLNSYSGSVSIPSSVSYNGKTYSVTSIGWYAFSGCSGLTSITIPNSVTSIGNEAFYGCSSLTSITIPESVTSIGNEAFYGCYFANNRFINNSALTDYENWGATIYDGEETDDGLLIKNGSIIRCRHWVTSITIPESVTSIGWSAFSGCSSLTSITIPESVTSIGWSAFSGCSSLTSITIPESVTSIGSSAFENCSGLTSITILCPKVGSWFSGITSIKEVILGNSVTSIGESAFYNTRLKSVTIGSGVLSIGSYAFGKTRPVKVIWLTNTPPEGYTNAVGTVNYVANDLYTKLDNKMVYPYLSSIFEVDGVRYVPVSPSERTCDAIDCLYDSLATHINIGEKVSYRGVEMKVKDIKPYTFYQNPQIIDISLGNDGYVGDDAFYGCLSMKDVTLSNQGNIGNSAFQSCTNMQSVTLGDSITSIGSSAFDGCKSLQSIIVPNAVTWIGNSAFQGCSSLTNMQIGENVKTIYDNAFNGCSSLPSINIPKSVTSIGNSVFSGCSALKTVVMEEDESELSLGSNGTNPLFSDCPLDSVYIGRNILYNTNSSKGYSPFYRNTSLRSVHITDKETEISDNEFYGCTNLKNVHIGNGVTSIGNWAFSGCSSLDRFSFGHSVESIGQEAFSDCTAMTRLMSLAPTPPVCGSQALDDINKWSCTLTVPATHSEQYKVAEQWKEFFFIEEGERIDFTLTYMVDGETYKSYDMLKDEAITPEAEPTKEGYTFSGWSEIPETMPAEDVVVTGTFTVNSYVLTYMVDGEVYKTDSIAYGTSLTPEAEPIKDGYTFSGWSEIPETMPAEDVVVTGTFTVNSYVLTYMVDGEVYKTDSIAYGTSLTPEAEPTKDGYTFSGWSEIPETMPAEDVVVTGTFIVNRYTVTFMYGNEVLSTIEVEYGAEIPLPESLGREDLTLIAWLDVPESMPAYDIIIYAEYVDGISSVADSNSYIVYDEKGIRIPHLKRGINIVRMSDGKVRKVIVK